MFELDISIYDAEKGIEELIVQNTSISHIVEVKETTAFEIAPPLLSSLQKLSSGDLSERSNFDLFYLQSLLVSSVWNGNDDYFAPIELWLARNTAKDKPFNYEHNESDIIGHMISSYVIDKDGKLLDENLSVDDLPDTMHIMSGAVLYKHWVAEDKKVRMAKIIDEIRNGEWYVSVECLFPKFDYLLKSSDNTYKLISRNEETAFLTKHLRIYGGTGVYNNQKIARVPRNFILSGKGLVKKPANSMSTIFASKYELSKNNFKNISNNLKVVYKIAEVNKMNEKEFAELKVNYSKLETEYNQLKSSLSENKTKELTAQLESVTKTGEAAIQEINVLKASLEKVSAEKVELSKIYDELNKQKSDVEAQLKKIESEKSYNERLHLCQSKMGMTVEQAKSFADSLSMVPDEAFAKHVEFQVAFVQSKAGQKVIEKVEADPKVLDNIEKVIEPSLSVAHTSPTKNEEIVQLSASLADYMKKNNIAKQGEVKFKK